MRRCGMRLQPSAILMFLFAGAWGMCSVTSGCGPWADLDRVSDSAPPAARVSEEQRDSLRRFLEACSITTEIKRLTVVGGRPVDAFNVWPAMDVKLIDERGNEQRVRISATDGTVLVFITSGPIYDEPGISGLTVEDAISKDAAWQAVQPLLSYYGLPVAPEQYEVRLEDIGRSAPTYDLSGRSWAIKKRFAYRGVPIRGSRLRIVISAYSGKIVSVAYSPPGVPHEPARAVSKEEAIVRAIAFLGSRVYSQGHVAPLDRMAPEQVEKVIARPTSMSFLDIKPDPNPELRDWKFVYCWEIPLSFTLRGTDRTFPAWLRVDLETGSVIGGNLMHKR